MPTITRHTITMWQLRGVLAELEHSLIVERAQKECSQQLRRKVLAAKAKLSLCAPAQVARVR